MGTTDINGVYTPSVSEVNWGTAVNTNFGIFMKHWQTSDLCIYVNPTNGSDSDTGLSPMNAMATISAAYTALKTYAEANITAIGGVIGVGTIILSPGRHDVGTSFIPAHRRPVIIKGTRSGHFTPTGGSLSQSASIIYSSSGASPTELIRYGGDSGAAQGFGLEIEDVSFELASTHTSAILLRAINHFRAERCVAYSASGSGMNAYFVRVDNDSAYGGDGSWGKILDCKTSQVGLLYMSTTGQFNYWNISRNDCTMGLTVPYGIYLVCSQYTSACFIGYNHFEAGSTNAGPAIYTRSFLNSTLIHNYGECTNLTYPFYDFGGEACLIMGGRCTSQSSGTTGLFVQTTTGAQDNTIMVPGLRESSDSTATSLKDRYLDQGTARPNHWHGGSWSTLGKGFMDVIANTAPSSPATSSRRMYADSGNSNHLTLKKSDGTTVDLESPTFTLSLTDITTPSTIAGASVSNGSGNDSTNTVFTTSSVSPTTGRLILFQVTSAPSGASESPVITGLGLTWVEVGHTADFGLAAHRTTLYRAMGTVTPGTVTITFGGSQDDCVWTMAQFTGMDTSGTNGSGAVAQYAVNTAAPSTSLTCTTAATLFSGSAMFGSFAIIGTSLTETAGSGFTILNSGNEGVYTRAQEFKASSDTTVDITWTGSKYAGGVAVEIKPYVISEQLYGKPVTHSGATAAARFVGGTTTSSPATGTFAVGDFVIAQDGHLWICTAAGTPGTWRDSG